MGNTRKDQFIGKVYPLDKNKYSKAAKYPAENWAQDSEYEELTGMKGRMKPQAFKAVRRNTYHEDNKDE